MDAMLKIDLSGSLVVVDTKNIDRTPRGQKTCGVLAILATAPRMRPPRRWVQSKLWSDRGTENANASLRQSLVELRRTFGPYADAIQSDRKDIWLDEAAIRVVMPGDPDATASGDEEFLSGIDIKDEVFEDWLRDMRMSYTPFKHVPSRGRIQILTMTPRYASISRKPRLDVLRHLWFLSHHKK